MDKSKTNAGFTLVEVLASIVILSIVMLSFFQFFVLSTKTAKSSQGKLITTHLAKATIERVKLEPESFIPIGALTSEAARFSITNCQQYGLECDLFEVTVNDRRYQIDLVVSRTEEEKRLGLINLLVEVNAVDDSLTSKLEGYVIDEEG